jgi:zinc transporter
LLGINVGGIPGADNDYAFLIFLLLLGLLVGGLLILFRRWRWL